MSNLAFGILTVIGIIIMAIFVIICCFEGPCYKAKIIQKGTHRYEVWFYYLCGTWEDNGWGWTTLHYRKKPTWKFSGNTGGGRYKEAVFETLKEAEHVKAQYDKYITMYGRIE